MNNVQIELWHLITLAGAAVMGFWAVAKVTGAQFQKQLDARFTAQEEARRANHKQLSDRLGAIESASREDAAQWQRVERELLNLKADLPLHYVRREDYVQAIATIMTKLDAMALRFENILLRGNKNHE